MFSLNRLSMFGLMIIFSFFIIFCSCQFLDEGAECGEECEIDSDCGVDLVCAENGLCVDEETETCD